MNTDNKARLIEELKPCPFCGSTKVHMEGHHWIMCAECLADGPGILGTTEAEAIEAWNRRIEAAGLLAGSVGVPSVEEIIDYIHDVQANRDTAIGAAKAIHAHLLTRSPEPKGRWISEELAKELELLTSHMRSLRGKKAFEALRNAPRAKEE